MESVGHTPGPWALDQQPGAIGAEWWIRGGPGGRIGVASVWKSDDSKPSFAADAEGQANARLIAAAPELVEACRLAEYAMTGPRGEAVNRNAIDAITRALAKAGVL